MSSSLAERLLAERHRQFVGRTSELSVFQAALVADELPFTLLHLFGPGGVGKTTLVQAFMRLCDQQEIAAIYLDGRNLEAAPDSFMRALAIAMKLPPEASPLPPLSADPQRQVILIDTYEVLQPLDQWLHETFLPQLSANTLIVLSGRQPPAVMWRSDPGWQAVIRAMPLRNFSPQESRTYLARRQIPPAHHQAVLDFTHGYPLALSLVADLYAQGQAIALQPNVSPDLVKPLLERFVRDVPSSAHRMALEACAVIRLTTEALLAELLSLPDVHHLFEWLRGLSFMEAGDVGLFPHDLAREVLIAELRWRDPDWYTELHARARTYYTRRLEQTQGQEQHRVLFDYIFLHRDNPAIRPKFTWQETSSVKADRLQPSDVPSLLSIVEQHEGAESARLASHWFTTQPQGAIVFRNLTQEPVGFVLIVALHQADPEDLTRDPGAAATWQYLRRYAPLRSHEGATLFRFWMARDTYQTVSPTQSLIFITFVQHHRNTPGLAYTFFPCADPDDWAAMFTYADLHRLPEADFSVGDRTYGVYGHDWRVVSPSAWQELLAQREIAASAQAIATTQTTEPVVVLSQPEFMDAVWDALRQLTQANLLHHNPLLHSRLVNERIAPKAEIGDRVKALQLLIQAAADALKLAPRESKYYRAVLYTYLQPAATQEQAAERLDLPFSTYRRHLKAGINKIADRLWQQEVGG